MNQVLVNNLYLDLKSAQHSAEVKHVNTMDQKESIVYRNFHTCLKDLLIEFAFLNKEEDLNFSLTLDNIVYVDISKKEIIHKYITSIKEYISQEPEEEIRETLKDILKCFNTFKYSLFLD